MNGRWPTAPELARRFPRAHLLTIAVTADADAECLDIETGDATPADAPAWYARQKARGVQRPCLYASAVLMQEQLIPALKAAGIDRADVRLWSAHYAGRHICGVASCGELSVEADGTQWTDRAFGRDLDQSLLVASFFDAAPPPAPSVPAWQEAMMQALPVVRLGDSGEHVRTVQGLAIARGHQITCDGDFGQATAAALDAIQHEHGVAVDHVVGPVTWAVLVTGAAP